MPVNDMAREASFAAINNASSEVIQAARDIYSHPEPAGDENRAADVLTALLERHGFEIERGIAGLPSSFRATKLHHNHDAMRKGLRHGHVAFLAAYDADPESGHVYGHHLSACVAAAAAIGLGAALAHEYGTVTVFGCPGPQHAGGAVALAREGLFNDVDAVLGGIPARPGEGYCHTISRTGETVAVRRATITFDGETAGQAIEHVRTLIEKQAESLGEYDRVEIVETIGGSLEIALQGETSLVVLELSRALAEAAQEAGNSTGVRVDIDFFNAVDDMIVSRILARRVKTYADTLGFKMDPIKQTSRTGPTGWGSASYAVPTFRLQFPFTSEEVEHGERSFARAANTDEAYEQTLRFAQCLSFTGLDVLRDMEFRAIADDQLVKELRRRGIERKHRRWLGVHPVIRSDVNGKKRGPKLADFKMVRGSGDSN